jgi:hypothetical protein
MQGRLQTEGVDGGAGAFQRRGGRRSGRARACRLRCRVGVEVSRGRGALVELWGREGVFMGGHRFFVLMYTPWRGIWRTDSVEQAVRAVLPAGSLWYGALRAERVERQWLRRVVVLVDFGAVPLRRTMWLTAEPFRVGESRAVVGAVGARGGEAGRRRGRFERAILAVVAWQERVCAPDGLVSVFGERLVTPI